jgi:hypothetical protein
MWDRMSKVAPLLVLALIAYGCGTSASNPTAPQITGAAGGTLSTEKKLPKVDICHITGNGKYVMINVSENAQPAHLAHGDSLPGQGGLDENCVEVADDFVTFTGISATAQGEGASIYWTVEGTSDPVTYSLQGRFDANPFEDSGGSGEVPGTGQGTYSVVDYYGYDEYRVRAVDGNGNEVFSPGVVVQY